MLNQNPLWRYLVVVSVLLIALLYALPNLYPEDPALNISATRGGEVTEQARTELEQSFAAANIGVKSVELKEGQILARFNSTEDQLQAREVAAQALGNNYVTALNLAPATPDWLTAIGASPMNLGLDLRGGVHFLMAVDMKAALDKNINDMVQTFRADLREDKIRYRSVQPDLANGQVLLSLREPADVAAAEAALKKRDRELVFTAGDDELTLKISISEIRLKEIREYALEQNITIIRNRVNEIGVAEPLVQRQGADRIVVQLPGVQDTATAKEILGATASLEFRLVDEDGDLAAALAGRVPPNAELYYTRDGRPLLLEKRIMLTGEHITGANSAFDEYSRPQVSIKLDAKGGNMLSASTRDSIGRRMASVFIEYKPGTELGADGTPVLVKHQEVINDATIQARLGRDFRITGIDSPG